MTDLLRRPGRQGTTFAALGAVAAWALAAAAAPADLGGLVSNLGLMVAPLSAAVCCAVRGRRHRGVIRRVWFLLSAATAAWALGQAVWTWYESVLGVAVPFPSPADYGYLALPPLAAAALISLPLPLPLSAPTAAGRVRAVLDGLLVATSLFLCSWVVVLRTVVGAGGDTLALVISLAYPVSDVVLITLVLHTWNRARAGRRALPLSLALLGAGLLSFAVADTAVTYLVNTGSYASGSVIDVGWGLGFVLILLAAARPAPATPSAADEQVDRPVGLLLPYVAVVVALAVAAAEVVLEGTEDTAAFWVLAVVVVLLVVRQVLTVLEVHVLTQDLEERVSARTAQLRVSQDMLARQAFTDSLTGLPNRALFRDRLEETLRWDADAAMAVFFLDLDGFKAVNDTLGHGAGDALLREVAARLQATVRPGDVVARFGGDEFAVLLDALTDAADAEALARRIGTVLGEPVLVHGEPVHVTASIGVAFAEPNPADGDCAEAVLRNADLAMYAAKDAGGGYAVYHPGMHRALVERVRLEADLRRALPAGEFVLEYQPLVAMRTGRISGVEALVRWRHPERGLVPPAEFIPLAESTGLIGELGLWVLRTAAVQAMDWYRTGGGAQPLAVHVNVSPRQLQQEPLVAQVVDVLAGTGLPATCLTLELTEGVLLEHDEHVVATLHQLRALGVRVAIDDFGMGYSSLSYLHRFPLDVLKIDRSFVQRLAEGGDPALVTTILQLGQTLLLETVAEGIERSEERQLFEEQGCTTGQGFHFSPPVPAGRIKELLAVEPVLLPG